MVVDIAWTNLQLDSLLQKFVGEYFPHGELTREFRREEVYSLLRVAVRESFELYQKDFALGLRKALSDARLKTTIDTFREEEKGERSQNRSPY